MMGKFTQLDGDGEWECEQQEKCLIRTLVKPSEKWKERMLADRVDPPVGVDLKKLAEDMEEVKKILKMI